MIISKMARKLRRSIGNFIFDQEDGVTAIEFAMIAPVFFLLMGSLMETGIMLFTEYVLQTSVQEASRLVRTGQAQSSGLTSTLFKTEICNSASVIANCSSRVTVRMVSATNFSNLSSTVGSYLSVGSTYGGGSNTGATFSCGATEQPVALIATYDWDFTMPFLATQFGNVDGNSKRRLGGIYIFQNEPFPTTGTCGA